MRHRRHRKRLLTGLAAVMLLAATQVVAQTTTSVPIGGAPEGRVSVPLNTSSTPQTKIGSLGVEDVTTVNGNLTVGKNGGTSLICWNDICRSNWNDVVGLNGYLRLEDGPDTGYTIVVGTAGAADPSAAVGITAGTPVIGFPTYGVRGVAVGNAAVGQTTATSAAVRGFAVANTSLHAAVYATTRPGGADYSANAWAGYFFGSVGVGRTDGTGTYDLVVGAGSAINNGIGELCLGGTCRSTWPTASGTGLWTNIVSGGRTYTSANSPITSVGAGGSGTSAPFHVALASSGGVPTSASLAVRGTTSYNQYVVGTPQNLSVGQTCGDGVCNNTENDIFGSANYCPVDCDVRAPNDVFLDETVEVPQCPFGSCPQVAAYLYVHFYAPPDVDVSRVRVIIRTDRYPTGPLDSSFTIPGPAIGTADIAVTPNQSTYHEPPCQLASQGGPSNYYVGAYAFDAAGNFAPGSYGRGYCLNTPHLYL